MKRRHEELGHSVQENGINGHGSQGHENDLAEGTESDNEFQFECKYNYMLWLGSRCN